VLLRPAYLGVSNAFALLPLLPMSDRDKDAEILALRHQLCVLQRRLGSQHVRFPVSDRALLAALLHRLPRNMLQRLHLIIKPDTVLPTAIWWRADTPNTPGPSASGGRAPCARSAPWCCAWSAKIRARILGASARPTAAWVAQAANNLVMDLEDSRTRARFLIRDRDGKFPDLFDAILSDAGIEVVLSGVRMPRMNSIMERWVQTCRHELLDRTLIWNQAHLLHALREFEHFYNDHRLHQGIANARPLHPLPVPLTDPVQIAHLDVRRRDRLGGTLHEYEHAA